MPCPGDGMNILVIKGGTESSRMTREGEWKLQWLGARQEGSPWFQMIWRSQLPAAESSMSSMKMQNYEDSPQPYEDPRCFPGQIKTTR